MRVFLLTRISNGTWEINSKSKHKLRACEQNQNQKVGQIGIYMFCLVQF